MGIFSSLITGGLDLIGQGINWRQKQKENKKQRKFEEKWNQIQQNNWQQEFDYTKMLNENQYQMQAKDQIMAGVNPVAANGGSMQGFSANISPQTTRGETPQLDTSQIANAISQYAEMKFTEKENEKNRENAKKIAEINAEASKYGSDTQAAIAAESRKTQKEIADSANENQKEIAKLNTESQQKITKWNNQTQKDIQKAMQEWTDSEDHAKAAKRLQEALEDAYNYGRELEAMKHLYITEDGSKYRLDDYLKMLEAEAKAYENSPTRRSESAIYRGVDRLLKLLTLGGGRR